MVVTKEETQVESMVLLMVGKMAARLVAGLDYQKVELTVDYMVEKMAVRSVACLGTKQVV